MYLSIFTDELGMDVTEALPIIKSWSIDCVDFRAQIKEESTIVQPGQRIAFGEKGELGLHLPVLGDVSAEQFEEGGRSPLQASRKMNMADLD